MASPHHLLNTSWTSHRLSPLHHGNNYKSLLDNPAALKTYAARLRDHLTNSLADTQGWRGEEDSTALSNIGALRTCTWETISTLSLLQAQQENGDQPAGILITLSYEAITYKAALLSAPSSATTQKRKRSTSSTYLPLLLTRLPKALRETFISFLSATFDTYCSTLRLPSSFMCDALETYVGSLTSAETGSGSNVRTESGTNSSISSTNLEDVIREIHLTLSFAPPISPSLKALNISIPRETFTSFVRGDGSLSSGESQETGTGSVLSGLSAYLQKHVALELGLPISGGVSSLAGGYVRLTRVACAGFVVTGEGRMKLVAQALTGSSGENDEEGRSRDALRASEALLRAVLERAVTGE